MNYLTHVRRCHVCDGVTESIEEVTSHCEHCGKPFAPFFYFDERSTEPVKETQEFTRYVEGEYRPLRGLTVYW